VSAHRGDPHDHGPAQLAGRYWPTRLPIEPPRRPDGTVDITALCRLLDDAVNAGAR